MSIIKRKLILYTAFIEIHLNIEIPPIGIYELKMFIIQFLFHRLTHGEPNGCKTLNLLQDII